MFRIRKTEKGFIAEVKIYPRWRFSYWKTFILTSGLDEPWYHSTHEFAMINLLLKVKWDILAKEI